MCVCCCRLTLADGLVQESAPGKPALQLDPVKVAEALQRFTSEVQKHVASQHSRRAWSQEARQALLLGCEGLAQVRCRTFRVDGRHDSSTPKGSRHGRRNARMLPRHSCKVARAWRRCAAGFGECPK